MNKKRLSILALLALVLLLFTGCTIPTDTSTRAIETIDYAHHETHEGEFYYVKGQVDVTGAATNLDFLWCVPNTTKWPHAQWLFDAEAQFILSLYEDVDVSANGTAVAIFNANRNSANTPGVVAYVGPTLAGGILGDGGQGGTLVWQSTIGSGKTAGQGREVSHEFIGKQNTDYWYQITKEAAGTAWVVWDFNWYEHAEKPSLTGDEDMDIALMGILLLIAAIFTGVMVGARRPLLGFPAALFWALGGAQAFVISTVAWDLMFNIGFGATLGMISFSALGAYAVREKRDSIADDEIDAEPDTEDEPYADEKQQANKKPTRAEAIRERARIRREKNKPPEWFT